jgi:hypothetical protein
VILADVGYERRAGAVKFRRYFSTDLRPLLLLKYRIAFLLPGIYRFMRIAKRGFT